MLISSRHFSICSIEYGKIPMNKLFVEIFGVCPTKNLFDDGKSKISKDSLSLVTSPLAVQRTHQCFLFLRGLVTSVRNLGRQQCRTRPSRDLAREVPDQLKEGNTQHWAYLCIIIIISLGWLQQKEKPAPPHPPHPPSPLYAHPGCRSFLTYVSDWSAHSWE